ncbi:beta-L-arabinofuranosidase domain-containing protein [Sphingobacterium sp. UBA1498]|uniref:beta-L-arabinofuranosidase domain-containing protein n=1 Tax=Sphingobacterium sp. UBA1498 TaxID=1947481 RepID=UPI00260124EE|nr:beta-L-arabinofuranosidase domain-containing protein [Sphingobacterium sp. UBA1498]
MKTRYFLFSLWIAIPSIAFSQKTGIRNSYLNNRLPLMEKPYIELPIGSIKPKGWLLEMLERQKNGATGKMDELYPQVMGNRNGWLGGDGDQWERGPYWIDGLLPLAYILNDQQLKDKVQPWIESILGSQRKDGNFGPAKDYPDETGIQRDNAADWWPRMVVLKIMQQYYSATKDRRVINFFSSYFKYQLKELPGKPLDNWTFWAKYRAADNLQAVYWLYNITGEKFLLDLGHLLHQQSYDFVNMFLQSNKLSQFNSIHCVNLAQGLKEPLIYYQQNPDSMYYQAVKTGLADIRKYNGLPQGMFGGDEGLHGNNPTQGSELCSAVELMYSLEKMLEITGDVGFADHIERIAFNALPSQVSDDFMDKQYFQQANQVAVTRHTRNFYEDAHHEGTDVCYGTLSGYPCCFSNMHQGWPKFTQNLWYATADKGIAALLFSPSEVVATVGDGKYAVHITEETYYPVDDLIKFSVNFPDEKNREVEFPFHVRIPSWTNQPILSVNGKQIEVHKSGDIAVINRKWKSGDRVELKLPMEVETSRWFENSIAVERGPLVYGLEMEENWVKKEFTNNDKPQFGDHYYEVTSPTKWNYGILEFKKENINEHFEVIIDTNKQKSKFFWNKEYAPIKIRTKAKEILSWNLYNEMAGPLPFSVSKGAGNVEEISLIPYGCTTLRISEFPLVR